jgi:hypothetical protein
MSVGWMLGAALARSSLRLRISLERASELVDRQRAPRLAFLISDPSQERESAALLERQAVRHLVVPRSAGAAMVV